MTEKKAMIHFVNIGVDELPRTTEDGRTLFFGFWGEKPKPGYEKVGNLRVRAGDPELPLFAKAKA